MERFEQAFREPSRAPQALAISVRKAPTASAPKAGRWTGWPKSVARSTLPSLPGSYTATPSKPYPPPKIAKAETKTRRIDDMFDSGSQKLRKGSFVNKPRDSTVTEEHGQVKRPVPTQIGVKSRVQHPKTLHRRRSDYSSKRSVERPVHAEPAESPTPKQRSQQTAATCPASARPPQLRVMTEQPVNPSVDAPVNCRCGCTFDDPRGTIRCVSLTCRYVTWHKGCGGKGIAMLNKHQSPTGWLCPDCRAIRHAAVESMRPRQSVLKLRSRNSMFLHYRAHRARGAK